jgi:hypothetical protein
MWVMVSDSTVSDSRAPFTNDGDGRIRHRSDVVIDRGFRQMTGAAMEDVINTLDRTLDPLDSHQQ